MESGRPGLSPNRPRIGGIPEESALVGRRVLYSEVVSYGAEAQSRARGAHAGDLLLQLSVHDSFQRHVAVVHDNVNRRQRLESQGRKRWVAVNRASNLHAEPVIHIGKRQQLKLVAY